MRQRGRDCPQIKCIYVPGGICLDINYLLVFSPCQSSSVRLKRHPVSCVSSVQIKNTEKRLYNNGAVEIIKKKQKILPVFSLP